jgi:hypothetical protein
MLMMKTCMTFVLALCLIANPVHAQGTSYSLGQVFTISASALPGTCSVGGVYIKTSATIGVYVCTVVDVWERLLGASEGGAIPAGSVLLVYTGACPTGFTEVAALNGKMLRGTVAANMDIGGTGGADVITPAGTIAWPAGVPTHSGTAISDHASHTHTYTDVVAHTHGFTDARGATSGAATTTWTVGTSSVDTTSTATTLLTASTGGASGTTAGPGATLTHTVSAQGTVAWPAGVPALTGTAFNNRPAYVNVIFCEKD